MALKYIVRRIPMKLDRPWPLFCSRSFGVNRVLEPPNKALEPTRPLVTDRAAARSAPAGRVAHL